MTAASDTGAGSGHGSGLPPSQLVEVIADLLGSRREARWIVDHGGVDHAVALADRRLAGEPLQYVLGRWPFRQLELTVDPRVLIPRPETEQVVEVALDELRRAGGASGTGGESDRRVVDLGTGSGAIALSLALEGGALAPGIEVWATDVSVEALEVARLNVDGLAAGEPAAAARVRLSEGVWFAALPEALVGRVDLVVSNPPYVSEAEYPDLDAVVRDWEPKTALVTGPGPGGEGGMAAIETIVAEARRWLRPTGALVVEIAPAQAIASVDAARRAGFRDVMTAPDLAGRVRILVARP